MNRRSLLRFLGLAPVAAVVPAVVEDTGTLYLAPDYGVPVTEWQPINSETIYLAPRQTYMTRIHYDEWSYAEFGEPIIATFREAR